MNSTTDSRLGHFHLAHLRGMATSTRGYKNALFAYWGDYAKKLDDAFYVEWAAEREEAFYSEWAAEIDPEKALEIDEAFYNEWAAEIAERLKIDGARANRF